MGFSSKQVHSGDRFDWAKNLIQTGALELPNIVQIRQQQQQQQQQMVPPLKCPRCDSSNTKFCYYNNYNRSQPRHFCKSCRRHWTKGGTLRNVPVGGGRKNKRLKTKNDSNNYETGTKIPVESQQKQPQQQEAPNAFGDEKKNLNDILYQSLLQPTTSDYINNNNFLGTTLSLDSSLLPLPKFSSPSSSSSMALRFQLPNVYGKAEVGEDHTTTTATTMTTTTTMMPWQTPISSSSMDPSSYWNWEDLNTIISNDIKLSWEEDSENKQ